MDFDLILFRQKLDKPGYSYFGNGGAAATAYLVIKNINFQNCTEIQWSLGIP